MHTLPASGPGQIPDKDTLVVIFGRTALQLPTFTILTVSNRGLPAALFLLLLIEGNAVLARHIL
jgi:hypothetical protein